MVSSTQHNTFFHFHNSSSSFGAAILCFDGHRATPIPNPCSLLSTSFRHLLPSDRRLRPPQLRRAAALLRPPAPTRRWDQFPDSRQLENRFSRRRCQVRGRRHRCWRLGFDFVAESRLVFVTVRIDLLFRSCVSSVKFFVHCSYVEMLEWLH